MSNKYESKIEYINQNELSYFFDEVKRTYSPKDAPFTANFPLKFANGVVWNAKFGFSKDDGYWFKDWE